MTRRRLFDTNGKFTCDEVPVGRQQFGRPSLRSAEDLGAAILTSLILASLIIVAVLWFQLDAAPQERSRLNSLIALFFSVWISLGALILYLPGRFRGPSQGRGH